MVLDQDTFDPDAVFLEDIVDDEVIPTLSLAVDGLMGVAEADFDAPPRNVAPVTPINPSTRMPVTRFDPEQLEVYGWESSLWRKIRGYLGF